MLDIDALRSQFDAFFRSHRAKLAEVVSRETALLEMGAIVMAAEHYRLGGFSIAIENAVNNVFKVKLSSRGQPYNFSWFRCSLGNAAFEIHSNLAVAGAHGDGAIYVVDVAVTKPDCTPRKKSKKTWTALANNDLITFIEVKKLVIYPMLLAQFVGIVHEIMPTHIPSARRRRRSKHFDPSLVSLGWLKGTSGKIVRGFKKRRYRIRIVDNFNAHLEKMRDGHVEDSSWMDTVKQWL